jgi:hypothetical protein
MKDDQQSSDEKYIVSCLRNATLVFSSSPLVENDLKRIANSVMAQASWSAAAAGLCARLFQRTGEESIGAAQRQQSLRFFKRVVKTLANEATGKPFEETRISGVESSLTEACLKHACISAIRGEQLFPEALQAFEFFVAQVEKLQPNTPSSEHLKGYRKSLEIKATAA